MPVTMTDGSEVPNALVLGMQRCIVETFDEARWTELGYATDTSDIIDGTYRLRRSLSWGDSDYPECVFNAVRRLLEEPEPPVLDELLEFLDLENWLEEHEPRIYAHVFADATMESLDEISRGDHVSTIPELMRHARRMRDGLETDPEQAIGSAKELLETVMKSILEDQRTRDDIPRLMRRTRQHLGLESEDPTTLRTLNNLSQLVVGVAEMRNTSGTGHGRAGSSEPGRVYARLAVDAAVALSHFLLGVNRE